MILDLILWFMCELIEIFATVKIYKKITRVWDNSPFATKKATDLPLLFAWLR